MATNTLEQAVINLLTTYGFLKDSELIEKINFVKDECNAKNENIVLSTLFRSINTNLRRFSFEIKSIHLTNSNGERVTYHGLVNTEEDFVAKEFGAPFDATELKFFAQMVSKLMEEKFLSTQDILALRKNDKIKNDQAEAFISRLEALGWLRRDHNNYIVLGVKAHLELRSYLESLIMDSVDLESLPEAARGTKQAKLRALVAEMPQIIVY